MSRQHVETILHPLAKKKSVETCGDVRPVGTAVTIDYSLPQESKESPILPVPVGRLSNSEILENLQVFLAHLSPEE